LNDFVRFLAAWALVHESADEGWKAAVGRGRKLEPGDLGRGPEAFVDGLAALVAEEKERLKATLADGEHGGATSSTDIAGKLDALGFELAELRGRIESLQASIDAIAARGRD
jgi:transketolase N-terminal domain/subunit